LVESSGAAGVVQPLELVPDAVEELIVEISITRQ
jgi:hypothetical protein